MRHAPLHASLIALPLTILVSYALELVLIGVGAFLLFFARPYMFSAALPPAVLALIHAGLDVLDSEPERVDRLRRNTAYLRDRLRDQGFTLDPDAAIIPLLVPPDMHIRRAAYAFHEAGLFVNAIEWPAVPADQQRFRISLMSEHTEEDLDTPAAVTIDVSAGMQITPNVISGDGDLSAYYFVPESYSTDAVYLTVYSISGENVGVDLDGSYADGPHGKVGTVTIDAAAFSTGVYFIVASSGAGYRTTGMFSVSK